LVTQFSALFPQYRSADFSLFQDAPYSITAERDILWIDEESAQKKRDQAEREAFPVFRIDDDVSDRVMDAYRQFREFMQASRDPSLAEDKAVYYANLKASGVIRQEIMKLFLEQNARTQDLLLSRGEVLLSTALAGGVFSTSGMDQDLFLVKGIEVIRELDGRDISTERELNEVLTLASLPAWLASQIGQKDEQELIRQIIFPIIQRFMEENGRFDMSTTLENRRTARRSVTPEQEVLKKGLLIVEKSQPVTREIYTKIQAYEQYAAADLVNNILGILLLLVLVILLAIILQGSVFASRLLVRKEIIFLAVTSWIYVSLAAMFYRILPLPDWLVLSLLLPTATISMLVAIFISAQTGIIMSLEFSLLLLCFGNDMASMLFALMSGIAGCVMAQRASRRFDIARAGIVLLLYQALLFGVLCLVLQKSWDEAFPGILMAALNGFFCVALMLGFLPLLEHIMNTPTRFRLMELSDTNIPIMKKLLVMAPGTYSHSMNVANMAETAATAINANALLARVGALFHDIGKIDQPEYFIENQSGGNIHDDLKPSLSTAVIKAHVKLGVEKAKELDLPQAVIDIISQHHGKGIISFFFHRAKSSAHEKEGINPEDFSYQGSRPNTREAAVVMLADAVEAACRTLKKPTPT
ncbi:MAG: HDIG domain-containing protein, partial [Spirochaetaceae bacterium]